MCLHGRATREDQDVFFGPSERRATAKRRLRRAPSRRTTTTTSHRRTLRPRQKSVLPHFARRSEEEEEAPSTPETGIAPDGPGAVLYRRHFSVETRNWFAGLRLVGYVRGFNCDILTLSGSGSGPAGLVQGCSAYRKAYRRPQKFIWRCVIPTRIFWNTASLDLRFLPQIIQSTL